MASIFSSGDYDYYEYTSSIQNSVAISVSDNTKTSYGDIPATIKYNDITYTVVSLYVPELRANSGCFHGCTNLITPPSIPDTVTNMDYAFSDCTNLVKAPKIPNTVTSMVYTFDGCISLVKAPKIPEGVLDMESTFAHCYSLEEACNIPSSVVEFLGAFQECMALSGSIIAYNDPSSGGQNTDAFTGITHPIEICVPTEELALSWNTYITYQQYSSNVSVTLVQDTPSYSKSVTRNDLYKIIKDVKESIIENEQNELNNINEKIKVYYKDSISSSITVSANASYLKEITLSPPSGYIPISIASIYTMQNQEYDSRLGLIGFNLNDTKAYISLDNRTSSSVTTTLYIEVVFINKKIFNRI